MTAPVLEFASQVVELGLNPVPLLLAFGLAWLIGSKVQALLVVIDLWLFMELTATLLAPGYRFGDLMLPRLATSALQVAIALGVLHWWRHRRSGGQSVTEY